MWRPSALTRRLRRARRRRSPPRRRGSRPAADRAPGDPRRAARAPRWPRSGARSISSQRTQVSLRRCRANRPRASNSRPPASAAAGSARPGSPRRAPPGSRRAITARCAISRIVSGSRQLPMSASASQPITNTGICGATRAPIVRSVSTENDDPRAVHLEGVDRQARVRRPRPGAPTRSAGAPARAARRCLWGGVPDGTNSRRASARRCTTCRAACRWPRWMGLKVPAEDAEQPRGVRQPERRGVAAAVPRVPQHRPRHSRSCPSPCSTNFCVVRLSRPIGP